MAGSNSGQGRARGNPQWRKGMASPNPRGRPPGIVDKRTKVTQALADDAPKVARVVIDAALKGDVQAASLVLSRVAPAIKSQSEKVSFKFDAKSPLAEQVEHVLQAIADGEVAPDVGKSIIDSIGELAAVKQFDEIEERILVLEGKRQ